MPSYVVKVGPQALRSRTAPRRDVAGAGLFPTFVTDADVKRVQQEVKDESTLLDAAVSSCPAGVLDAMTLAEWHTLKSQCDSFVAESPSFWGAKGQVDAGQGLQRELQPWHARLTQAGCSNVPVAPPAPDAPLSPQALLESAGSSLVPIAIAAVAIYLLTRGK